jgi:hypothetical protein
LSWTAEDRLLLFCCRTKIGQETKNIIIEAKKKGINWNSFLEKARENGVSAIVSLRLNEINNHFPKIPSNISEELKKDYYLNSAKNALIFEELRKVLKAFKESGLPAIVLKGAALASTVYENLALRPMTDVDLLVKKEDLLLADERLKLLGYMPSDRSANDMNFSSSYLTSLDYRNSFQNSPSFHIHWHFVNSTVPNESYIHHVKMENIWRDTEKADIAGVETLVMAPHHLIIHLSEHALRVSHSANKLCFFCDVNEAVHFYGSKLDWNKLVDESFKFHLNRMVYLSLHFTSQFLGTGIPEDVLLKLKPERLSLGERIFMRSVLNNRRFAGLSYLVHLAMNKGLARKAKFLWRTLFPPREILAQRNYCTPEKISALHYVRRFNEVISHVFKALD